MKNEYVSIALLLPALVMAVILLPVQPAFWLYVGALFFVLPRDKQ